MTLSQVKLFAYSLPLKQPLDLKGSVITSRDGLIISFRDNKDRIGYGEIAPLPGFSTELLEEATDQALGLIPELSGTIFPDQIDFESDIHPLLNRERPAYSARCGIEMALFDLCRRQDCSDEKPRIKINGLITTINDQTVSEAHSLVESGYTTLKLKVGRNAPEVEIGIIRELSQSLGREISLRLDGNQKFDFESAVSFCRQIENSQVEYFEEPIEDPSRLKELANKTGIPIALDESLSAPGGVEMISDPSIKAIVVKPTLIGGITRTLQLARTAQQCGTKVVISSAYESSVGIISLARLAQTIAPDSSHGLDTLDCFFEQLTEPTLSVNSGFLTLPDSLSLKKQSSLLWELSE